MFESGKTTDEYLEIHENTLETPAEAEQPSGTVMEFHLRIMTWNVWGLPVTPMLESRVAAIADYLRSNKGRWDIVAFQEAFLSDERAVLRTAGHDAGLSYQTYFHPGLGFPLWLNQHGAGLLVLSRWPIVEHSYRRFPLNGWPHKITGDWYVAKGCAYVRIITPAGPVDFFTTHTISCYVDPRLCPMLPAAAASSAASPQPVSSSSSSSSSSIPASSSTTSVSTSSAPSVSFSSDTSFSSSSSGASPEQGEFPPVKRLGSARDPALQKKARQAVAHDEYLAHRIVQMFLLSQWINHTTHRGTTPGLVVLAGDLNCIPGSLCYRLLLSNSGLTDSWAQNALNRAAMGQDAPSTASSASSSSSASASLPSSSSFSASSGTISSTLKGPYRGPVELPEGGDTYGTQDNSFSKDDEYGAMRLDYILCHQGSGGTQWELLDSRVVKHFLPPSSLIPGQRIAASDHWALESEFQYTGLGGNSQPPSPRKPASRLTMSQREVSVATLRNKHQPEVQVEALQQGLAVLGQGILQTAQARNWHTAVAMFILSITVALLWVDPCAVFGPGMWALSRFLIGLGLPWCTLQLLLGHVGLTEEIHVLKEVAAEMYQLCRSIQRSAERHRNRHLHLPSMPSMLAADQLAYRETVVYSAPASATGGGYRSVSRSASPTIGFRTREGSLAHSTSSLTLPLAAHPGAPSPIVHAQPSPEYSPSNNSSAPPSDALLGLAISLTDTSTGAIIATEPLRKGSDRKVAAMTQLVPPPLTGSSVPNSSAATADVAMSTTPTTVGTSAASASSAVPAASSVESSPGAHARALGLSSRLQRELLQREGKLKGSGGGGGSTDTSRSSSDADSDPKSRVHRPGPVQASIAEHEHGASGDEPSSS